MTMLGILVETDDSGSEDDDHYFGSHDGVNYIVNGDDELAIIGRN